MHVLENGVCVTCQPVRHELVDGQCVTCRTTASRHFDPDQLRDPHSGEWISGGAVARAALKIGKSTLHLEHHGDGNVSIHDEHGGSLHLSAKDLATGGYNRRSGKFRDLAYQPEGMQHVGDTEFMNRLDASKATAGAMPSFKVVAGIKKTHLGTATEAGEDHDEYEFDRQTLHLPADPAGVDDPDELFARPGTEMTARDLGRLADTLQTFSHVQNSVDTGHGHVAMHVIGRDNTLDTGKRSERPIVLSRGELRNVDKALTAAFEAYDPDEGTSLPADERFQRVIPVKASGGDITVTRNGPDGDFWVENDTTSIRIAPEAFHDFSRQLDAMLNVGGDLKGLIPVS